MSTLDSKIEDKYYTQEISMIPLEYVARLAWNEDLGRRLKTLRGKTSRRILAERIKARNVGCSHQGIQQIELGQWETVDLALILIICEEIGASLNQLLPMMVKVQQQPKGFTIPP